MSAKQPTTLPYPVRIAALTARVGRRAAGDPTPADMTTPLINQPVPTLLRHADLARPMAEVDQLAQTWLQEKFPDFADLSESELQHLIGSCPELEEALMVRVFLRAVRPALVFPPNEGFDAALTAFHQAKRLSLSSAELLSALQEGFGGVVATMEQGRQLLIPQPTGEWWICDGERLYRRHGNPFTAGRGC